MKGIQLSPDLELLILNAIMQGHAHPSTVKEDELSKEGQYVHESLARLIKKGGEAPFSARTVFVTATDVLGGDAGTLREFIREVNRAGGGANSAQLLETVRDKQRLIRLVNMAGEQLGSGSIDLGRLQDTLVSNVRSSQLDSLAKGIGKHLPDLPEGPRIKSLPRLSEVSGGVFGFWAVGGEPGVGKSTFALQIAVSLQRVMPVLYYDFEQGREAVLSHLGMAFDGDVDKVKRATKQLYLRDSLKSLNDDLRRFPPPAMIVVDSIQKAPTSAEFRRTGIDQWIHRFEAMKRRGYTVLGVSEINRAFYGESQKRGRPVIAKMGGFKESGEIEYAADFGLQLFFAEGSEEIVEVHVVKNRHRQQRGRIGEMERVNAWWWKELGHYNQDKGRRVD